MLPESIHTSQCHQPLRVQLPSVPTKCPCRHEGYKNKKSIQSCSGWKKKQAILFVDSLQSSLRDLIPVGGILLALLEEANQDFGGFVLLIRIDVEARNPVNNDLCRTSISSRKCGQATGHGFHHREPESFVQSRLRRQNTDHQSRILRSRGSRVQ